MLRQMKMYAESWDLDEVSFETNFVNISRKNSFGITSTVKLERPVMGHHNRKLALFIVI